MSFSSLKVPLIILASVGLVGAALYFGGSYFVPDIAGNIKVAGDAPLGDTAQVGARAAYFDLPDTAGNHVTLANFAHTPLVIVFWATWNSEAADQIKILDDYLAARAPNAPALHVIAIDSQEEPSVVTAFMRRGGYAVPTLVDAKGIASNAYGIKSVPTFFFVDAEGLLVSSYTGVLSARGIGDNVEHILR